jgi:hypothetical protein
LEIYFLVIIVIFVTIEFSVYKLVLSINKKFQWLILSKDENPKILESVLEKFLPHGFDPELGWVRKSNTEHLENGKYGKVKWTTNFSGARTNPKFEKTESQISCYGDSFAFCRQVNDDETWEHYLSKIFMTNVQNFGVGNYGLDQTLLRLKREYTLNPTKIVIIGVVPDTISRILSMWKHYYEYGNTLGFKPRFKISNNDLELIKNPIDTKEKFLKYTNYLNIIQENDFFYKTKFSKEKITFPYCINIFRNWKRNSELIKAVKRIEKNESDVNNSKEILWKPMSIIMEINLKWRVQLFQNKNNLDLIIRILEEYVMFSKQNNFLPVFVFLPQKDDLLFIKKNYYFYENMINEILKIKDLVFFDITKELIQIKNLDELYSDDNDYGGHYSANGNKKISELIANELREREIL